MLKVPAGGGAAVEFARLDAPPTALGLLSDGKLAVGAGTNLAALTQDGTVWPLGSGFKQPTGIATDSAGTLYVADLAADLIYKATPLPPGTPRLVLSETRLDFGTLNAGMTGDLSFEVQNTGTGLLAITNAWLTEAEFQVVSPAVPFTVAAGTNHEVPEVNVRFQFAPIQAGAIQGQASIQSNDPSAAQVITLEGRGLAPASPPEVYSVEPDHGPPGTNVTVRGTNFVAGDSTFVFFGGFGHLAIVTEIRPTWLVACVPGGLALGPAQIMVNSITGRSSATNAGGWARAPWQLVVTNPPDLWAGLVAYYPFSGSLDDAGGFGLNATGHNGLTLAPDRHGQGDSACAFNGVDAYLTLPATSLLKPANAVTLSLWCYREAWTNLTQATVTLTVTNAAGTLNRFFRCLVSP